MTNEINETRNQYKFESKPKKLIYSVISGKIYEKVHSVLQSCKGNQFKQKLHVHVLSQDY